MRRLWRWAGGAAVLAAAIAGCQERLTSPAECPELCPGGNSQVFDTVVVPEALRDSSFTGYVEPRQRHAELLSSGFAPSEDRAIYKFAPRGDSITVRDTVRAYTVDSVLFTLTLLARDTLVGGLKVYLYRLPSTVDSTHHLRGHRSRSSADATLIDSIAVPDSVHTGAIKTTPQRRPGFGQLALPAGGDSVLAIGLRMRPPRRPASASARSPRAARRRSPAMSRSTCPTPARSATQVVDPRHRRSTPS